MHVPLHVHVYNYYIHVHTDNHVHVHVHVCYMYTLYLQSTQVMRASLEFPGQPPDVIANSLSQP